MEKLDLPGAGLASGDSEVLALQVSLSPKAPPAGKPGAKFFPCDEKDPSSELEKAAGSPDRRELLLPPRRGSVSGTLCVTKECGTPGGLRTDALCRKLGGRAYHPLEVNLQISQLAVSDGGPRAVPVALESQSCVPFLEAQIISAVAFGLPARTRAGSSSPVHGGSLVPEYKGV